MSQQNRPLTTEEKSLFAYIDSLIPEDGHLVYDLRDPKQYQFAILMNKLGGFDHENYPGFHAHLEKVKNHQTIHGYYKNAAPADDESFQTTFDICNVGQDTAGLAAGTGYGTVVGGFDAASLTFVIQDQESNVLAYGSNAGFANSYVDVTTDKANAKVIPQSIIRGYMHYDYQSSQNSTSSDQSGVVKKFYNGHPVADPSLTHPTTQSQAPWNPNAINIGINRQWSDADIGKFDYYWKENISAQPIGKIPFVGSVTFNDSIEAPLNPNANFFLTINVTNTSTGGTIIPNQQDMINVYQNFYIDPNDSRTLVWNLPPATNGSGGNPIVFSNITWPTDMTSNFFCSIGVKLISGAFATAIIMSSLKPDDDHLNGSLYIKPIEFIWHCLGEGTQVLLANGKDSKAIENFVAGDTVVINNNGDSENVTFTNKGAHYGKVLKILTDKGHSLVISHNHVVMTPIQQVHAAELSLGDEVIVQGGTARIDNIVEIEDYQGYFYNLCIGEYRNHRDTKAVPGAFFANGILVGDIKAQRILNHQHSLDKKWLKANLAACWSKDIDSYFAAKK